MTGECEVPNLRYYYYRKEMFLLQRRKYNLSMYVSKKTGKVTKIGGIIHEQYFLFR